MDREIEYKICGSYRRGGKECGDIDILITHPSKTDILPMIVEKLSKKGFLIDHLTSSWRKKYMGVCKIEDIARRIDIIFINYDKYYPALLYFTGSKVLNIQLRLKARKLGYSLSENGIRIRETDVLLKVNSEREIFEILGEKYIKPRQRNI